jgi:hypothetical protein
MTFQDLLQQIRALNSEELIQVVDLIQSLQEEIPETHVKERILGLGKTMGSAWIGPDFDKPLFADDWMDNPSDPLNRKHDKKDADQ